jgi:hypothetical protein
LEDGFGSLLRWIKTKQEFEVKSKMIDSVITIVVGTPFIIIGIKALIN